MESVPSLPTETALRAFVIWASAGMFALVLGVLAAGIRRRWAEARWAAMPIGILCITMVLTHLSGIAHGYATWITVAAAGVAAFRTSNETSFFLFLGGIGLVAASLIASTRLF
jgi:hypothetical protein